MNDSQEKTRGHSFPFLAIVMKMTLGKLLSISFFLYCSVLWLIGLASLRDTKSIYDNELMNSDRERERESERERVALPTSLLIEERTNVSGYSLGRLYL